MTSQNIIKRIMISPRFINDQKYIINKIYEKEKKCNLEGYIEKINKINSIKFNKFYEQNFSGSILVDVDFNADIVNLNIGEIVKCKVIKSDEDGIVAEGTYPIYIIIDGEFENLSFINVNDIIDVEILKREISISRNIIKAVAKYVGKREPEDPKEEEDPEEEED